MSDEKIKGVPYCRGQSKSTSK